MARTLTWTVVLVVLALLAALAELALLEAGRPRTLGIRAETRTDGVYVTYALPAGWAWDCGLRPGDRLLQIDGRPAEALPESAVNAATAVRFAKPSGQLATGCASRNMPDTDARRAAFLFIAGVFVMVGAVVAVLVEDVGLGLSAFAWSFFTALALVMPVGQVSGRSWAVVLENLALIGFGASTLTLFARFPAQPLPKGLSRGLLPAFLAWHGAIAIFYLHAVALRSEEYEWVQPMLHLTLAGDMALAIVSVATPVAVAAVRRRTLPPANAVLLIGVTAGLAPFMLLSLVPHSLGIGYLAAPDTTILSLVLLPLSLAATMGRLFTIHSWLRRGLIRLFVWTLLLIGYGLLLTAIEGRAADGGTILRLASSPFIEVVIVGATLPLLERTLRRKLERALLQDVYSFPAALHQFASRIVHLKTAEDIAAHTLASLGETLDLRWAALMLSRPMERRFQWGACPDDPRAGAAEITPLAADGEELGVLAAGPKRHDSELLPQDRMMIQTIAPLLAISLQLVWQLEIVAQHERDLELLSQKLLDIQEEVRRRIALELHDDAIQRVIHLVREFDHRAQDARDASVRTAWRESLVELVIALRSVCVGLYPTVLDDLGLPAGLEQLVSELRAKTDISADLLVDGAGGQDFGRLDRELELALYRIAQESLNNVRKHSSAQHVLVRLRRLADTVELIVADDGAPPMLDSTSNEPSLQPDLTPGLGVVGMRHRLARWGGSLTISDRAEGGIQVQARAPLAGPPA